MTQFRMKQNEKSTQKFEETQVDLVLLSYGSYFME